MSYAGNAGMSAFAASDTLLMVFWSIPAGMAATGRILMSVSAGEEDRQTLRDIFKILVTKCMIPVIGMAAFIILMAEPFTNLYYHDPSEPVYQMTITAVRLLPLTMPLSLICMTWSNYAQVMRKQVLIHTLSFIDGALAVCASAMVLVPSLGMTGIYLAAIFNGVVTAVYPLLYSAAVNRGIPKNADQLLMIPDGFGVPEEERLDLSLESREEAVNISQKIQHFCRDKGIDSRRSYLSALCLEEMAAAIIDLGFAKDNKPHSVDVRVVHKDDSILLRIKDDCIPFDPMERAAMLKDEDLFDNIGLRMVMALADDVSYYNMMGLNVLTISL
jgi:anti-sigma regulatory factor (Ser/Thr protein kinase)